MKLSTGLRDAILGTNCFATVMTTGIMDIYSGAQPANADAVESGTLLVSITVASGAFVGGSPTSGLIFDTPSGGVIPKNSDTWSGVGVASGTAGWFRFYDNDYITGASSVAIRFDGVCALLGGDLNMASLTVTASGTITLDSFEVTLPAY